MELETGPTPAPEPPERTEPVAREDAVRPDGPAAAVMISAGIGALVLAILVVIAEAKESFKNSLAYSDRVGPLSGKTIWAVVAFAVSWLVLSVVLRRREVDLGKAAVLASVLLALALVGTFSPFFELFKPE